MTEKWMVIYLLLVIGVQGIVHASVVYRRAYLREKLRRRLTPEENLQVDKTDLDFWSFLK